jgi:hypothetical protein
MELTPLKQNQAFKVQVGGCSYAKQTNSALEDQLQ